MRFYKVKLPKAVLAFSFLLFLQIGLSKAQGPKPLRVEIESDIDSENFHIAPIGSDGLIMFNRSDDKAKRGERVWYFTKYDTQLKKTWTKEFPVDNGLSYVKHYVEDKNIYLLLSEKNTSTGGGKEYFGTMIKGKCKIIKLNPDNGDIKSAETILPTKISFKGFNIIGKNAFIYGNTLPGMGHSCLQMCLSFTCIPLFTGLTVFKFQPFVANIDLSKNSLKIIPTPVPGNAFIVESEVTQSDKTFSLFIKNKQKKDNNLLLINKYTATGKLLQTDEMKSGDPTKILNDSKVSNLDDKSKIMIGTYRTKQARGFVFNPANPDAMGLKDLSSGFYFTRYEGNQQKYIKFHEWNKFKKLWNTNTSLNETRLKKKADRKGTVANFNYSMLVHDIVVRNDNYIMIAEIYYRKYHTTYTTTYTNGKMTTTSQTVFVGFQFTHTLVAAFDKEGKLLWDNVFEDIDILSQSLKEKVKVTFEKDRIALVYSYAGEIQSMIIRGSEVLEKKQSMKIATLASTDKVKESYDSDMEFWYDKYFVSWGYQKIKSETKPKDGKRKRKVFYMNKIAFQ